MSKIRQIIHLRRVVNRWRSLSLRPRTVPISRSDEDSSMPVRAGFIAILVGRGPDYRHRFVIPIRFINFPVFLTLLRNAEEEIGIQPGVLVVVCEVELFRTVLELLESNEDRFKAMEFEGFQQIFARYGGGSGFQSESSCKEEEVDEEDYASRHYSAFSPLLRKTRV